MIKKIISNNPDADNLRQILEAMKGDIGSDTDGHIFFMGLDLTSLELRVKALEAK